MSILKKIDRIILILVSLVMLVILLEVGLLPVYAPEFTGRTVGKITKAFKTEILRTDAGNENKR